MEIEKNILTDDDSDTDYDCDEDTSSDSDDENFTRKFGDIKTKTSYMLLPEGSVGRKMGGKWSRLDILTDAEVVVLLEVDGVC